MGTLNCHGPACWARIWLWRDAVTAATGSAAHVCDGSAVARSLLIWSIASATAFSSLLILAWRPLVRALGQSSVMSLFVIVCPKRLVILIADQLGLLVVSAVST